MKIKQSVAASFIAASILIADAASGRAASVAFQPGEILVSNYVSGSVRRYSPSGSLIQTYGGEGIGTIAAGLTPDGNLVVATRVSTPKISIFSPDGALITTFAGTSDLVPGDVSVFPDGTLAITGGANSSVQFWSQAGTLLRTISVTEGFFQTNLLAPVGSTIGTDGILYVGGSNSFNIARFDSNGTFLGTIRLGPRGFPYRPGDLVMNPVDGTLWVTGSEDRNVHHITTDGVDLGSFATGFDGGVRGIALSPDNQSLYVTKIGDPEVKHFNLNGNLLGSFNFTSGIGTQSVIVVPYPVPEPVSAVLAVCGAMLLGARRRRALGGSSPVL